MKKPTHEFWFGYVRSLLLIIILSNNLKIFKSYYYFLSTVFYWIVIITFSYKNNPSLNKDLKIYLKITYDAKLYIVYYING